MAKTTKATNKKADQPLEPEIVDEITVPSLAETMADVSDDEQKELSEEELAALLLAMGKEKEELENRILRLQADFDNFRKRTRQEKEAFVKYANTDLLIMLLSVADNLERAMSIKPEGNNESFNMEAFIEGMQMIYRQLINIFENVGVKVVETENVDFNPEYHEAVMQEDAGAEMRGKIIMELQKGYLLNDRLLRPAMVKVGQ